MHWSGRETVNFAVKDRYRNLQEKRQIKNRPSRHHLIRDAKYFFLDGRETEHGYLKPNKKLLVDMVISKPVLDTALEVLNTLFFTLEDFDYRVNIAPQHERFQRHAVDEREKPSKYQRYDNLWSTFRPTIVYIGTVAIGLTLFEIS